MNVFAVIVYICSLLVLASAQFGFSGLDYFGNGLDANLQSARDPRQNPGPVVFPPAPPDNGETSGVVVGASGYGFVPPNKPRYQSLFSFF